MMCARVHVLYCIVCTNFCIYARICRHVSMDGRAGGGMAGALGLHVGPVDLVGLDVVGVWKREERVCMLCMYVCMYV